MRLKLLVVALGAAFLLFVGFRPGVLPYTPGAPFSDAVTSHLPAAQFFRQSMLEDHTFPVWRETIMAGQPFAADPLNKTAYPFQWLALLLPSILHLDLMIVLHLLIAGAGMWTWARALGLGAESAALSALAYALAPRVIGHIGAGHLDLLYALAWFPWLMESVGAVIDKQAKRAATVKRLLFVALFSSLILLADVRLSLFASALAMAYALYEAARLKRFRWLWRFAPAGALVVVLTLALTAPLLGWRPYLSRGALTAGEAGVFSLAPAQFIGMVLPAQSGNVETLSYVGLPVLALAIIGIINARQWFWAAAAGVAALYAMGANGVLWSWLVQIVPALLWFRVPSRAWLVVALVAPLLAGFGLQWLIERRHQRGMMAALVGTVVALSLGAFVPIGAPILNGLAIAVGGAGFGVVMLFALRGRLLGRRLALAMIVVTFLDLALVGRGWLEWRTPEAWLPPDQVHLAERLTGLNAYRIYSPTYSLQQQVAEDYHLRLFGGVDPFQLSGIAAAVEQGGGIEGTGYSVVLPPLDGIDPATANRDAEPNTEVLGRWGVTHVVAAFPLNMPTLEQVDVVDGVYIYSNRDPALTTDFPTTPAWAAGWDGLPDRQMVEALNQLTATAALISGVAMAGVVGALALLRMMKVKA